MKQINVELENCYGIKKLQYEFDFSAQSVYAIYAPNGSMKSSLAQTFKDISQGFASKDRIFPARVSARKITDKNGTDLSPQSVLVLPPYDEVFSHDERTSLLLVNDKLRKEYEQLHLDTLRKGWGALMASQPFLRFSEQTSSELSLGRIRISDRTCLGAYSLLSKDRKFTAVVVYYTSRRHKTATNTPRCPGVPIKPRARRPTSYYEKSSEIEARSMMAFEVRITCQSLTRRPREVWTAHP